MNNQSPPCRTCQSTTWQVYHRLNNTGYCSWKCLIEDKKTKS